MAVAVMIRTNQNSNDFINLSRLAIPYLVCS